MSCETYEVLIFTWGEPVIMLEACTGDYNKNLDDTST